MCDMLPPPLPPPPPPLLLAMSVLGAAATLDLATQCGKAPKGRLTLLCTSGSSQSLALMMMTTARKESWRAALELLRSLECD